MFFFLTKKRNQHSSQSIFNHNNDNYHLYTRQKWGENGIIRKLYFQPEKKYAHVNNLKGKNSQFSELVEYFFFFWLYMLILFASYYPI